MGERLLPPIFQYALDRIGKVLQALIAGLTLSMRIRHFRTRGNEILFTAFDDSRELVLHFRTYVNSYRLKGQFGGFAF